MCIYKKNHLTSNGGLRAKTLQTSSILLYTFFNKSLFSVSVFKLSRSVSFILKPDSFNLDILSGYVSIVLICLTVCNGS